MDSEEKPPGPEDPEIYEDNTCDTIEVTKDFVKLTEELWREYIRIKEHYKQRLMDEIRGSIT